MIALALVFAFSAVAEEAIVIGEADCRLLTRHVPAADVTYEAGVDVRGNAVASADLGAPQISLPDEISIDVTALVYDLLKTTSPPGLKDTAIELGKVVFRDGRLTYNGQPLGDAADAVLVRPAASGIIRDSSRRRQFGCITSCTARFTRVRNRS